MSKKKIAGVTLVIAIIVFGLVVSFQAKDPIEESAATQQAVRPLAPNPYMQKMLATYDEDMLDLLQQTKTPGLAIAIVQDSTILFMKTYGVREVGTRDSIDKHTVFRLASVSKCFAPLLTGLLVEDGVLRWNDRVIDHLPAFELKKKESTEALRLTHVLSHTTGLPYHTYTTLVEDGQDLGSMLTELKNVNIIARPGELYSYQNVAYSIIGEVIRSRTGKPYEQVMEEKVFGPLRMRDASMTYQEMAKNDNVAKPHLHW